MWYVASEHLFQMMKRLDWVAQKPGVPPSEFFRLTPQKHAVQVDIAGEVYASFTINGEGDWPFEKPFYLDRRVFLPFVFAGKPESVFTFDKKHNALLVINVDRRGCFDSQPNVPGYGLLPKQEMKVKVELDERARTLVRCAHSCAASDMSTPHLNCVYVKPAKDSVYIYASNQKILFQAKSGWETPCRVPVPFPLNLIDLLDNEGIKEIQWVDKVVALRFDNGYIWQPVPAKAIKEFPVDSISKYFGTGGKAGFTADVQDFAAVLARLGSYIAAASRQDWVLKITGLESATSLTLSTEIAQSSFVESISVAKLQEAVTIEWPLGLLLPLFEFLGKKEKGKMQVQFDKGRSYVTLRDIKLLIAARK